MIRNFSSEALHCVDAKQNRAWDQIVTRVITSNPPPFDTDPQITEWIERKAIVLQHEAERCTITRTEQKVAILHE
jgi:hypothetical protein